MKLGASILFFFSLCALPVAAQITVSPAAPLSVDPVRITVVRSDGGLLRLQASSLTRNGNVLTVTQEVSNSCNTPLPSTLRTEFAVPPLDPGAYVVNWIIVMHGSPLNSCGEFQVTSSSTFVVTDVRAIPTFSQYALALLAGVFAAVGCAAFWR